MRTNTYVYLICICICMCFVGVCVCVCVYATSRCVLDVKVIKIVFYQKRTPAFDILFMDERYDGDIFKGLWSFAEWRRVG